MKFEQADMQQVAKMERAIEQALRPFAENTEAGLGAIACARVSRRLIEKYRDRKVQRDLRRVIADYIEDRPAPRDGGGPLLIQ